MKFKFFLFFLLLLLFLNTCEQIESPTILNPLDPDYKFQKPNTPSNLNITSVSDTEILLTWENNSSIEEGYAIERSINNKEFIKIGETNENVVQYSDKTINQNSTYKYRVYAYTSNERSLYSEEINIKYFQKYSKIKEFKIDVLDGICSVAFGPEGKYIAAGADNGNVVVWDINSENPILNFENDRANYIRDVTFSPDNKFFGSCNVNIYGTGSSITIWDMENFEIVQSLNENNKAYFMTFSPDNQMIAEGELNSVGVWNINSGERLVGCVDYKSSQYVIVVRFLSNTQLLYFHGNTNNLVIWNLEYNSFSRYIIPTPILSIDYNASEDILVIGSYDYIYLFKVSEWSMLYKLNGHSGYINSVNISNDGRTIASCGRDDHTIKIWETDTGVLVDSYELTSVDLYRVDFCFDNQLLVNANRNGVINILNINGCWLKI